MKEENFPKINLKIKIRKNFRKKKFSTFIDFNILYQWEFISNIFRRFSLK